jgi:signal peptide peptidase SppA
MRAYDQAMNASWAMLPEKVEELLDIAAREHNPTPEVLEAYRAARADNGERLGMRDNVAVLNVLGPMFKRANLMTAYSGATSYALLRRDLQVALDDPKAGAIMLIVDSPGGEVSGCDELAAAIYEARGKKPIWAYVSGQACSAGYWIAAAADRIIVSDSAIVGSIGAVIGITDRSKADDRNGVSRIEFVSSQSPGKRPDHTTDAGRARIQKIVDDLGAVFVKAVAKYRGVSALTVLSDFGQGGVEIGANAVKRGMVDEVGQFEATLAALSRRAKPQTAPRSKQAALPSNLSLPSLTRASQAPAASENAMPGTETQSVAQAVRARFRAFQVMEVGEYCLSLHAHLRDETDMPADMAGRLLKAAMEDLANPAALEDPAEAFHRQKAVAGALGAAQSYAQRYPDKWPEIRDAAMKAADIEPQNYSSWEQAIRSANRAVDNYGFSTF